MNVQDLTADSFIGKRRSTIAGVVLVVATLLEILVMAHHGSVHTTDTAEAVRQIAAFTTVGGWVHGLLMALLLAVSYGMTELVAHRGLHRPLIRIGCIFYGAGVLVMLGAALTSGFVITGVATLTPHVTDVDLLINRQLLILCRVVNQACANFGVVAMSVGIVAWSLDLIRDARVGRWLGILGLLVGVLPTAALIDGRLLLDVHGAMAWLIVQAVWNLSVGVALVRAKI